MPLHIDIRINRELINTLHIARVKGGTHPDDINNYVITDGPEPTRYEDWLIDGIPFIHRYGDGAEICVMKGIQAMKGGLLVTNANVTEELQEEDDFSIPIRYIEEDDWEQADLDGWPEEPHPPEAFRDKSNGE